MPKTKKDYWGTPEDWSKRKHLVLNYYFQPAAPKLRQVSPDGRVILLDGFAGRGEYKDGSPGSPVYMGQFADKCAKWKEPLHLRIFNVEPDEEIFNELEKCTAQWVNSGTMTNMKSTFKSALPFILKESDTSAIFAFLDPFCPSDLPFDDFLPLLQRNYPTEICFVLHTPLIYRMIHAVLTEKQDKQSLVSSLSTLDSVFGGPRWRQLTEGRSFDTLDIAECFRDGLIARSPRKNFFHMIHPIDARYGANLKYHIVFRTRHVEGVKLMNDAFYKELNQVFSSTLNKEQLTFDWLGEVNVDGPPIEQDQAKRFDILENALETIGRESPNVSWIREDLALELLNRCLDVFSMKEYRQAVDHLIQRGLLLPVSPDAHKTKVGRWITNPKTQVRFDKSREE